MKKLLLFILLLLSFTIAQAEKLSDRNIAQSYSKVVDGWTYITNASEFMLLVQQCANPDVEEKMIRLACNIEYPGSLDYTDNSAYFIKYFRGVFDGMGCTITNFNLTSTKSEAVNAAFIYQLLGDNSEVRNLQFDNPNVYIVGSGTGALVVNTVEGTDCSIHDIYVNGGKVETFLSGSALGGIACFVNRNTSIHHCAIVGIGNGTGIYSNSENYTVGVFCYGLKAGVDEKRHGCSIHDCYMTNISFSPKMAFSVPDPGGNCYYSNFIMPYESEYTNFIQKGVYKITNDDLTSGNDVLNDASGWVYHEGQMPLPAGLFYWNPSQTRTLKVGTYNSSQDLEGTVIPLEYKRYLEEVQLKLTGITSVGSGAYVINDNLTTDVGVNNPFTTFANNVFQGISMTTLQLPGYVTTVEGSTFRHGVTEGFVTNGNWRFSGNLLYLNTSDISRLMTSVGDNKELTIDGRYCNSILDEALKTQGNLENLYVNTWFPVGTTTFKPIELLGNSVFSGLPKDIALKVYVKDGTTNQSIIGRNIDEGYKYNKGRWAGFYSEHQDVPNRLFQYFPVTRNPAGLSTLMLGYPVELPSDCRAWVATSISDGQLVLKRVKGNVVPASLPVLLSYEKKEGMMYLSPYEGSNAPAATLYENSIFKGSIDPAGHKMTDSEMMTNFLTLSRPRGDTSWDNVGFYSYHPVDKVLPSYIAWISIQDVPHAKLNMVFDGDYEFTTPSGITDVTDSVAKSSTPVYNLSGQRVGSNYRGMVIKNGRKYLAK